MLRIHDGAQLLPYVFGSRVLFFLSDEANAVRQEASFEICVYDILLEKWLKYHYSECEDDANHQDEEDNRNF